MSRLLVIVCVLCALWVGVRPGLAQGEPTPTPAPDGPTTPPLTTTPLRLIESHVVEVIFPAMVRFEVIANTRRDYLKAAELHLTQPDVPGGIDLTVALTADGPNGGGIYINEARSLFNFLWLFTLEDAPPPFTPVQFTLRLETTNAGSDTLKGEFTFQDTVIMGGQPITAWQSAGVGGPVELYAHNPELALPILVRDTTRVQTRLAADFGSTPAYKAVIYDAETEFCTTLTPKPGGKPELVIGSQFFREIVRPCNPNFHAAYYAKHGYTLVRRTAPALDALQEILSARLAGQVVDIFLQGVNPPVPAWFREGLTALYSLSARSQPLALVQRASRNGALLPLSDLAAAPPQGSAEAERLWRAQSYLLTLYVAAQHGATAPLNIAYRLKDGFSLGGVFTTFYGMTLEQFYAAWTTWLFTENADNAVRWWPYSELTATPTATRPARPISTPYRSPTPRPTATNFPTMTPSLTPTLTPSNTPLPPGSLSRGTPLPTKEPTGPRPQPVTLDSALPIIGAGVGVLVVLGLAVIFIRRRRGR